MGLTTQSAVVFQRNAQIVYNRDGEPGDSRVMLRQSEGDLPSDAPRIFDDYDARKRRRRGGRIDGV